MATILWLEDEERLLGGFTGSLERKLAGTGCRLHKPCFTTAPELMKYLTTPIDGELPTITAETTCLVIDIMLPGHSYVHRPQGWLDEDPEERFFEAMSGRRAGLVLYRQVLLPKYNPPLPVIFLTSVIASHLIADRIELENEWRQRCYKSQLEHKKLNDEKPHPCSARVAIIQKEPGEQNISELLALLKQWELLK